MPLTGEVGCTPPAQGNGIQWSVLFLCCENKGGGERIVGETWRGFERDIDLLALAFVHIIKSHYVISEFHTADGETVIMLGKIV